MPNTTLKNLRLTFMKTLLVFLAAAWRRWATAMNHFTNSISLGRQVLSKNDSFGL